MPEIKKLAEHKIYNVEFTQIEDEDCSLLFENAKKDADDFLLWPLRVSDLITDEDEVFNEAFLALMRKQFLSAGEIGVKIVIKPVCTKIDGSPFPEQMITDSMKHAARRLKKCSALIGFEIPFLSNEKARQTFIDELFQKHENYIFFN